MDLCSPAARACYNSLFREFMDQPFCRLVLCFVPVRTLLWFHYSDWNDQWTAIQSGWSIDIFFIVIVCDSLSKYSCLLSLRSFLPLRWNLHFWILNLFYPVIISIFSGITCMCNTNPLITTQNLSTTRNYQLQCSCIIPLSFRSSRTSCCFSRYLLK